MDYYVLTIIILAVMLIVSVICNIILIRKIERLKDEDIIDDITPMYNDDEGKSCTIIYL